MKLAMGVGITAGATGFSSSSRGSFREEAERSFGDGARPAVFFAGALPRIGAGLLARLFGAARAELSLFAACFAPAVTAAFFCLEP